MKIKKSGKKRINPLSELRQRGGYLESITDDLEQVGIDFFMPDESLNIDMKHLTLPERITDVPSRELGEYLNAYTQQKMYMRTIEGYAELTEEAARRDYMDVAAAKFSELFGTKLSETAKEREVNSSPEVRERYEMWVDCKMKVKLIQSNITSIEDAIFLISREVSRRSGDFDNERRADNVSRK